MLTLFQFTPFLLYALSSLFCYASAILACKLLMQRFSFSLPLFLAVPTLAVLITLRQRKLIPQLTVFSGFDNIDFANDDLTHIVNWPYIVLVLGWWFSFLWLVSYVWFPTNERLALVDK